MSEGLLFFLVERFDPYYQLIVTMPGLITRMEKCAGYTELGHLQCVL